MRGHTRDSHSRGWRLCSTKLVTELTRVACTCQSLCELRDDEGVGDRVDQCVIVWQLIAQPLCV